MQILNTNSKVAWIRGYRATLSKSGVSTKHDPPKQGMQVQEYIFNLIQDINICIKQDRHALHKGEFQV